MGKKLATEEKMTEDEIIFLSKIPSDGTSIGNGNLRKILGWESAQYIKSRDLLLGKGLIQTGRGRGGSVSLIKIVTKKDTNKTTAPRKKTKEKATYPIFKQQLIEWAANQAWQDHLIEHRPDMGKKNTGGMWTRPDFVVIGCRRYEYTPGRVRDIETFEIKITPFSIDAVFETASHSRFATKSYLAIFTGNENQETVLDPQFRSRVESECQRFGIGLLLFKNEPDSSNWEWLVDAVRKEPDPDDVEQYITRQVGEEQKKQIRKWFS